MLNFVSVIASCLGKELGKFRFKSLLTITLKRNPYIIAGIAMIVVDPYIQTETIHHLKPVFPEGSQQEIYVSQITSPE